MNAAQILANARGLLGTNGSWCQGALRRQGTWHVQRCSIGAIGDVVLNSAHVASYPHEYFHSGTPYTEAVRFLAIAIEELHPEYDGFLHHPEMNSEGLIIVFNDDPGTKYSQVLAAFDRAVELATEAATKTTIEAVESIKAQALEGAANDQGPGVSSTTDLVAA